VVSKQNRRIRLPDLWYLVSTDTRFADAVGSTQSCISPPLPVYNHLHTVHAIASCNAAEMAMGMLRRRRCRPAIAGSPRR
jgi:hypothetical protein